MTGWREWQEFIYIYTHIYMCIYICIYIYIHIYIYIYICIYTYTSIYTYMWVYIYLCIYIYTYIHTYIYNNNNLDYIYTYIHYSILLHQSNYVYLLLVVIFLTTLHRFFTVCQRDTQLFEDPKSIPMMGPNSWLILFSLLFPLAPSHTSKLSLKSDIERIKKCTWLSRNDYKHYARAKTTYGNLKEAEILYETFTAFMVYGVMKEVSYRHFSIWSLLFR
jgi:hypothetical protein